MKMAVELLSFDPDGDLLLVLADNFENDDTTTSEGLDGGAIEQTATQLSLPDMFTSTTLSRLDGDYNESPPLELELPKSQKEIHMLVSSKHLMLASPVFKAMLQHSNFKEGDTLRSSGKVKVELPDDDPAALRILLDIIHGRVRQVPRHVNLKIMTELSVLVDKYQMLEVVELYVEVWMSTLKSSVPMFFTADLLAWLSISWVFGLADIFKQISRIAMRGSTDLFGAHESHLPIPQPVFGKFQLVFLGQIGILTIL
jgi:BTB/POZ domain